MAHFRGTIQGNRGEASRLGSKAGGLVVTCNGWHDGVKVEAQNVEGRDVFQIFANGGSAGDGLTHFLGAIVDGQFIPNKGGKK